MKKIKLMAIAIIVLISYNCKDAKKSNEKAVENSKPSKAVIGELFTGIFVKLTSLNSPPTGFFAVVLYAVKLIVAEPSKTL